MRLPVQSNSNNRINTEADDETEALEIGTECLDWGNADITVEESDDE